MRWSKVRGRVAAVAAPWLFFLLPMLNVYFSYMDVWYGVRQAVDFARQNIALFETARSAESYHDKILLEKGRSQSDESYNMCRWTD